MVNTHIFSVTLVASLLVTGACGDDDPGMEVIIDPDNSAPTLTDPGDLALTTIDEDTPLAPGDTVADILDGPANTGAPITDADTEDQQGIVVIGADNTNGAWQYDPDGDGAAGFTAFGTVSNAAAVVLASTARIRFVPDENFNGAGGTVTFRAWDQTGGLSSGARVNIDDVGTGDPTPFSSATAQTTVTVVAVNDAPRNTGGAPPAIAANEGVAADVNLSSINIDDVDLDDGGTPPNDLSVTLTATGSGTLSATAGTTGVMVAGNGTSSLTLTGTLAELNDFFDDAGGADLQFTLGVEEDSDSIRIVASDGGLTGSGSEPAMGVLAVVSVNANASGTPGTLTFVDFYQNGNELGVPSFVTISSDSRYVYVGASVSGSISTFSRDSVTDELSLIDPVGVAAGVVFGGSGLSSFALSPDGTSGYATAAMSNVLHQFARDTATGRITGLLEPENYFRDDEGIDGLAGASGVVVSPDGNFVYVSAGGDAAVSVFSRNAGNGVLTPLPTLTQVNGVGSIDGLVGAAALVLSPDGTNLYVAGEGENKLAVFSRNAGTGALTFRQVLEDGVNSVDGLAGVWGLAVSLDGNHLYAAGRNESAIAVFSRAGDGRLSFQSVVKDGQGGVDDLGGAFAVAVSPDGQQVYAVALNDHALLTFDRNPTTGALTFVNSHIDNVPPVDGLGTPTAVAVSPDGGGVYATGSQNVDSAVAAFSRDTGP